METMLEIHHISLSRPWASIGQMILPTNSYGKWKLCAVLNPTFPTHFEVGTHPNFRGTNERRTVRNMLIAGGRRSPATLKTDSLMRRALQSDMHLFIRLRRDHGLGRGGMRNSGWRLSGVSLPCFGGFRCRADDPTKPWLLRTESFQRPLAQSGMVIGDHVCVP